MATKKKTETLGKTPKKTKAQIIKELSKEINKKATARLFKELNISKSDFNNR